jgi:hypothetical protein
VTADVLLVTAPDDVLYDGYRILAVDLTPIQSKTLSDSLLSVSCKQKIILYSWNSRDSIEWLIDKKHKSNLVIFNAESDNQILVGYLCAQKNSHYFGVLKTLGSVCKNDIYTYDECFNLLKTHFENHE